MAVKLIYKDVALGADEDAEVTAVTTAENFSDVAKIPYGADTPAIATGEPNGWGLTHDYTVLDKQPVAFWSVERSGADCSFTNPPTIILDFSEQYTATALTVRFAPESMDYCTQVSVTWYQYGIVKEQDTFYPDATTYIIENAVEAFDRIVFSFEKTNLPNRRVKVELITIGAVREFSGRELTSANFVHEISLISDTVPVNVLDAALRSNGRTDFIFQRKQPIEGYNGSELIGVYYIETGKRTGVDNYELTCCDIIGVLDLDEYSGGIWINDTPLTTILSEVFGNTVTFDVAPAYSSSKLRGYIEPGTKRAALQQIAFALGACVDTTGTKTIKIFPPPTAESVEISARRTYVGGAVELSDKVTEVTVTAYVFFDERPTENQQYIELNGVKYRYYTETKHAINPNVVASDLQNKKKFDKSYLVNLSNAQTLADNIMAYYMQRETYSFKHILEGQEPADRALVTLPWGDKVNGNITRMSISVTGIAVSDTEMLLDN